MKFKWDGIAIALVGVLALALIVNVLFIAFRPMIIAGAYNSQQPFNFTDSAGVSHQVTPTTSVSYTDVANNYNTGIMIFNLLLGVAFLILLVVETTRLIRHSE